MNESGVVATSHELEIKAGTETSNTVPSAFALDDLEAESSPEQPRKTYRERLEELDFWAEGNPNLKEAILSRVESWENGPRPKLLLDLAEYLQKSVDEVEKLLQLRMEEIMLHSQYFCATRVDVFINHILAGDRRYRGLLEICRLGATFNSSSRDSVEQQLFGFPPQATAEGESVKSKRPIYGYFSLDENGALNTHGKNPPPNCVSTYGRVTVKIRKSTAMRHATMSLEDSFCLENTPVCPVALPHFSQLFYPWTLFLSGGLGDIKEFLTLPLDSRFLATIYGAYTEVQYHGGLTVDAIDSVHLSVGNGLDQEEIGRVVAAVNAYNQETGNSIPVVVH